MHWGNILCRNRQDVGLHSVKHIEVILFKGHENQRRRITRQVLLYLYVYRRNGRVEYLSLVSNIDFVRLLFHVQLEEISLVWRRHYCKGLQQSFVLNLRPLSREVTVYCVTEPRGFSARSSDRILRQQEVLRYSKPFPDLMDYFIISCVCVRETQLF